MPTEWKNGDSSKREGFRLHLKALKCQEANKAYQRRDYLSKEWQMCLWKDEVKDALTFRLMESLMTRRSPRSVIPSTPSSINTAWREKICEWKYEVVDRFDLEREIVSISTFYLDRYLTIHYVDEELFQLVAMASIYLAIKLHSPKKVSMGSIAAMGRGLITVQHIAAMELSIMHTLEWHLHPPTPVAFIENFFPLISEIIECERFDIARALEFCRFLTELSVCAYPFIAAKPSSIAIAAILFSIEYFRLPKENIASFQTFAGSLCPDFDLSEVVECGKLLRRIYKLAVPNDLTVCELGHASA